jgi:PleD family two-component response regulator
MRKSARLIAIRHSGGKIRRRAMNRKPLILCADDSLKIFEGWKALLQLKGYDVLTASDGTEAFQEFVSHQLTWCFSITTCRT